MKIYGFIIILLCTPALKSTNNRTVLPLVIIHDSTISMGESTELIRSNPPVNQNNTLRNLTINNIVNGTVTISKLTLLGVTSVTATNNYPLGALCALEVASTLLSIRQQYLSQKLENSNTVEENRARLSKLVISNTFNLAFNVVSAITSFGVTIMNPQSNNLLTNLLLAIPTGVAGYHWSNHYEHHGKYKKIKKSDETLL